MIKVKGIENETITWDYPSPPKFYKRVSPRPDEKGQFKVEVFKLKSFNVFTKEAVYVKQKNQKMASTLASEQKFNFAIPKSKNYDIED